MKTQATEASSPCYGVSPVELKSKDKIISQVCGSKGHRTSWEAVSDHANCNQHKAAMAYHKMNLANYKVNNESVNSFSPIGHSLMNMDATTVWWKLLQFRSWLASRSLDLSFFVTACHNDRQTLNNHIKPWTVAQLLTCCTTRYPDSQRDIIK